MEDIHAKYEVRYTIDKDTMNVVYEAWSDESGSLGRFKGPAHQIFDRETGSKLKEAFYQAGELHRDEQQGPAVSEWDQQGRLLTEAFYDTGDLHRSGGKPAEITYDPKTGAVIKERFFEDGKEVIPQKGSDFVAKKPTYPTPKPF